MVCTACGADNPPRDRFCRECGARLTEARRRPPARKKAVAPSPARGSDRSLQGGLARLGVPVPHGGVRAFVLAALAGIVFSQLLVVVFPLTVGLVQYLLPLPQRAWDIFNQIAMAALTARVSFLVARKLAARQPGPE